MKEAIIHADLHVTIEDAPIPVPGSGEIIVRVVYSATNPVDWKAAAPEDAIALHGEIQQAVHQNIGKDFAGYVHAIGSNVYGFKEGDRVVGINHSSGYAEYAVAPKFTTSIIPENVSFQEAVSFGLPYLTAALGLYYEMRLPPPWAIARSPTPLIIYGASTAVGLFAVKLAIQSNIHPIIAIAGASSGIVKELLSAERGDLLLDYRSKPDENIALIESAVPEGIYYAFDAISQLSTVEFLSKVLVHSERSVLGYGLKQDDLSILPKDIQLIEIFAPGIFEPTDPRGVLGEDSPNIAPRAFSTIVSNYLTFATSESLLKAHPYEIIPGGLAGVESGVKGVKEGKNRGVKYIYEIAATPGLA